MFRPSSLLIIFIAFACSQKSNGDRSNAVPIPIKCYSMERAFFEALDSKDYRKYYDALFRLDSNVTQELFMNCYQVNPSQDTAFNNQISIGR